METKCLECNEIFYSEAQRLNHRCPVKSVKTVWMLVDRKPGFMSRQRLMKEENKN
jgi:hypothetical protein